MFSWVTERLKLLIPAFRRSYNNSHESTYRYLKVDDRISTSGQPTAAQFASIKAENFDTVINLSPTDAISAIKDQAAILAALGLEYVHIPVDFDNPSAVAFEHFALEMKNRAEQRVWIHCAANLRVSAFLYRYRVSVLGLSESEAAVDLDRIWNPSSVWSRFLGR